MKKQVFILGAGFTHAFSPAAPLIVDDYLGPDLVREFNDLSPTAKRVLQVETARSQDGKANLERLMTRVQMGMPYDSDSSQAVLSLVFNSLKQSLLERVQKARGTGATRNLELQGFAKHCVDNAATCISFNYDDILDEALWKVQGLTGIPSQPPPYWHPDGGYGFFCRPSLCCVTDTPLYMDKTSMLLLKLHGSVNWYPKFGSPEPFTPDALVHHESWFPSGRGQQKIGIKQPDGEVDVERYLADQPFIVPPVLVKSELSRQPVIRLVWSLAYRALVDAEEVTFIGYSMPLTDIASGFLFGESLIHLPASSIKVVNYCEQAARGPLVDAYKRVIPKIGVEQFDFRDALQWCEQFSAP